MCSVEGGQLLDGALVVPFWRLALPAFFPMPIINETHRDHRDLALAPARAAPAAWALPPAACARRRSARHGSAWRGCFVCVYVYVVGHGRCEIRSATRGFVLEVIITPLSHKRRRKAAKTKSDQGGVVV